MIARESEIESLMNLHGWDRDEAELVVDARLARLAAADGVEPHAGFRAQNAPFGGEGEAPPSVAASFECTPCECGGLCDNCEAA